VEAVVVGMVSSWILRWCLPRADGAVPRFST
jgi:hypothetical protein